MARIIITISILAMFFAGCKDDSNPAGNTAVNAHGIIPLKVGNRWIYAVTLLDTLGEAVGSRSDTITVTGQTQAGDETWFIMNFTNQKMTNRSTGCWTWRSDEPNPILYYRYPTYAGDWYSARLYRIYVDAVHANVTVPAGTYACHYYRSMFMNDIAWNIWVEEWCTPGIGLIRSCNYRSLSGGRSYRSEVAELVNVRIQ